MNQGERDELLVKLQLINIRDHSKTKNFVGFKGIEYNSLPKNCNLFKVECEANNGNEDLLNEVCEYCGITKASPRDKADIIINNEGYSIKSFQSAPPAIANHTQRKGWERIANELNISMDILDSIINDYWIKREEGLIKEDTRIGDLYCPFNNYKEELRPFIEYFIFKGTGSGLSKTPASKILQFSKPLDYTTWKISSSKYYDKIWNKLIFSIRSKGINQDYPPEDSWTKLYQDSYKGALHIRIR